MLKNLILSALLCAYSVQAGYYTMCTRGVGIADPNNPKLHPWGTEDHKPVECLPCADPNCGNCDMDYKVCTQCKPSFGPSKPVDYTSDDGNWAIEKCLPCPSGCGACSIDATNCTAPIATCPVVPIVAATTAAKGTWDEMETCVDPPGVHTLGKKYLTFTALVENGTCINCADKSNGTPEGFGLYIPPFCDMLTTAQNVAVDAFGASCSNPSLTLYRACYTIRPGFLDGNSHDLTFVFNGTCNSKGMDIIVNGGWNAAQTTPVNRANVVSEVDPPQGAPDGEYSDYAPPPPAVYDDSSNNDYSPPPASDDSPSPPPPPPEASPPVEDASASSNDDDYVFTPVPVSEWTWAAIPSQAPAMAPSGNTQGVPATGAVAPASSGAYRAVSCVGASAVVAYILAFCV